MASRLGFSFGSVNGRKQPFIYRWNATILAAGLVLSLTPFEPGAGAVSAQGERTGSASLVSDIRQSVLAADAARKEGARLAALDAARQQFLQLQADANADAKAKEEIAALAAEGIDADVLTSGVLSALQAGLLGGRLGPEERTNADARIMELIGALSKPELRIAALGDYAHGLAGKDRQSARALLEKALENVDAISESNAKNAALNMIAQVSTTIDPGLSSRVVDRSVARMWPARMRGYARYDIALRVLADEPVDGKPIAAAKSDALAARSQKALAKSDFERALLFALAISPEDSESRKAAVDSVVDAVLKTGETALLPVLATSLADASDQEDLLLKIIENRIGANRALDANALADYLPTGTVRAAIDFLIAETFHKNGMSSMASAAYERGMVGVKGLSGDERNAALIEAINGAISLERIDDALPLVSELKGDRDSSNALGRLAKTLADSGRIPEAEKLLPKIARQVDREKAISGIGRAKVRDGDFEGGRQAVDGIENLHDKGRVQSELARALARKGAFAEAQEMAMAILDTEYRIEALLRIADETLDEKNSKDFGRFIDEALKSAAAETNEETRDKGYLRIVEALSDARKIDDAKEIIEKISDKKIKARATGLISKKAALDGRVLEGLAYLASSAEVRDDEALRAEVLIAGAHHPQFVKMVSLETAALKDDMLRVRTSRAIAELQLKALDVRGTGYGQGKPGDYRRIAAAKSAAAEDRHLPVAAFSDGKMTLARQETSMAKRDPYAYPDISVGVKTIRAMMPLPRGGRAAVTLANLSPYSDKFMEDLAGGNTGFSYAAEAQGTPYPRMIVIESGVYTLGSLLTDLVGQGDFALVTREKDVVTLRAPLLVAEGATLILSGQEATTYRLSADAGSFIAVAGDLFIQDTRILSWDEKTHAPRTSNKSKRSIFRPYIVGWSNSRMMIGGSVLDSLGYAAPKSFGLAFSAGPKTVVQNLDNARPPSGIVADNFFHNFEYGFYSYEAEDVSLVGNEYRDNVLYAVDPHDRSHRLLIALNTTHGSMAKHGIIVSREVDFSWIVGNVSHSNAGSGFMIDRDSVDNYIYANVAFDNAQDGLTFFESSCNLATANRFFDNRRSGIKIRNSWEIGVHDNIIEGNAQAAIHGYISNLGATPVGASRDLEMDPYVPLTSFAASGNRLRGNGAGIKVDGASGFALSGNDYIKQPGRLIDGDGRAFEGHMLRFNDQNSVIITSTLCRPHKPKDYECRFRDAGYFAGDGQPFMFADDADTDTCTSVSGSVQSLNFNGKGDHT